MTLDFLPQLAFSFLLVFTRIGTMSMLMPGVGADGVPTRIRLSITLLLTFIILPSVSDTIPPMPTNLFSLAWIMASEFFIGLFVGLTAAILMSALQIAGTTIAVQTSLAFAQNTDPTQAIQGTLIANFLSILSVTLIFALDIHHVVIAAMHDSYVLFKPGDVLPHSDQVEMAIELFAQAFKIGVQLATPFIVFGLVFNTGVGILSRLMPQLQVFMIVMPANILLGFLILAALLTTMMMWYTDHIRDGISMFLAG